MCVHIYYYFSHVRIYYYFRLSGVETVENCVIAYIIISVQFPDSYCCV